MEALHLPLTSMILFYDPFFITYDPFSEYMIRFQRHLIRNMDI